MKRSHKSFAYFLLLLAMAFACTKEVTLFTEVEFELLNQREEEGFVNQGLPTTFTIVPEAELEGYEYTIVYEVTQGVGYFEDSEGKRLEVGKGMVLNPYEVSLLYIGSETGEHIVKVTAADNFGISEEIEVSYTLKDVPVSWVAESDVRQIELGEEGPITLTLGAPVNGVGTTYEANHTISEGSGKLGPLEPEGYAPQSDFSAIEPGTYSLLLLAEELGSLDIVFNLVDANGQELETSLEFEVVQTIEVISIDLGEHDELDMEEGGTLECPVTFNPPNATDQSIIWESSDPEVVAVDDQGNFSALSVGTATITATSVSNPDASATILVTVSEAPRTSVTSITVVQEDPDNNGSIRQLVANILPEDATDDSVVWSSGNDQIATVDENGLVTAATAGTVTITATSVSDPDISGSLEIEITADSLQNGTDILAFSLPVQNDADIDTVNHIITINVVDGTNLEVAPSVLTVSPGATIAPGIEQVRNFNQSQTYTVTAGNTTQQVWTVNVTVSPPDGSDENDIVAFTIPDQSGESVFDTANATITITVPSGTNLQVAPEQLLISVGAGISPSPANEQDFSNPVEYTVTAENGSERIWTINVNIAPPDGRTGNDITTFSLPVQNNASIDGNTHTVTVNVADGTNLNVAPAVLTVSPGATVTPVASVVQDFNTAVSYTVTAENGDSQEWTVNVTVSPPAGSSENDIIAFELPSQNTSTIDANNHTVTVNVADGTNLNVAPGVLTVSPGATVTPAASVVQDFNTSVSYTVTAENGTPQLWTVNSAVAANRPPVTVDDVFGAQQGQQVVLDVLTNDSDPDTPRGQLVITELGALQPPTAGIAIIDGSQIRFTPVATFEGDATFTYTINDGNPGNDDTALVTVQVSAVTVLVDGIVLNPGNINLDIGQTSQLGIAITPSNATNQTVTWSSSDTGVVTVDANGQVTAEAEGNATILATANDASGEQGSAAVTVNPATVLVTNVTLTPLTASIEIGETQQLGYSLDPANATDQTVTWSSSDPSIATVSATGLVSGVTAGTVTITATSNDANGVAGTSEISVVANQPPTVNAGSDQTITLPVNFIDVSGTAVDTDGTVQSYEWTQESSPAAIIETPNSQSTRISGLSQGTYVFRLTATDNDGDTGSDTITVTVNAAANNPPDAVDDNYTVAETGTLNRSLLSNDTDADNDDLTVDRVDNSSANVGVAIGGSAGGLFTISAGGNLSFDTGGAFDSLNDGETVQTTVTYRISDGNGGFDTATVTITVNGQDDPNQAPAVNAGANTTITLPTDQVSLAGSATDSDGTIQSVLWTKEQGGSATIATPSSQSTLVTGLEEGTYVFRLTATDDDGESASATVTVTVNPAPNQPPTVDAGPDITITLPTNSVSLTALADDIDGTIASYQWTSVPTGLNITNPTSPSTDVTDLTEGTYEMTITVTDDDGLSASDTVTVTVNAAPNRDPIAVAQVLSSNSQTFRFSGSGSSDPDGDSLTYEWNFGDTDNPINQAIGVNAQHTFSSPGTYTVTLTVFDGRGGQDSDTVIVVAEAPTPSAVFNGATNIDNNTFEESGTVTITGGSVVFEVRANLTSQQSGEGEIEVVFEIQGQGSWTAFASIGSTQVSTDTAPIPSGTYTYTLRQGSFWIGFGSGSVRVK